jgi:hypothetical protein
MNLTNAYGTSINKKKLEILLAECRVSYEFCNKKIVKDFHTIYQSKYKITDKNENFLEVLDSVEDLVIVSMRGRNFPFAAALIFALAEKYGRPELVCLDRTDYDDDNNSGYADVTIYYTLNMVLTPNVKESIVKQHRVTGYNTQLIECAELEKIAGHYLENYSEE